MRLRPSISACRLGSIASAVLVVASCLAAAGPPGSDDVDRSRPAAPAPPAPTVDRQLAPSGSSERSTGATADPRYGLLTPIPENGDVAPIVSMLRGESTDALAQRAILRGYRKQLQQIRRTYLSPRRSTEMHDEGVRQLREFTDPASFAPMIEVFDEAATVFQLAMLDHLADQGVAGQTALTWVAVHDHDAAIRAEASSRLIEPLPDSALMVIDAALRGKQHAFAASAGALAGRMNILQAIPLLISAQVAESTPPRTGDLAWIAVQKQTVYIQRLEAVAGNNAGAFQPVTGILTEGFVLRVQDAVVHVYRAAVNHALVAMTSLDYGESTAHLGYDRSAWMAWYNTEYLPFKQRQAAIEEMARP